MLRESRNCELPSFPAYRLQAYETKNEKIIRIRFCATNDKMLEAIYWMPDKMRIDSF